MNDNASVVTLNNQMGSLRTVAPANQAGASTPVGMPVAAPNPKKRSEGWLKFLRVVVWGIVVVALPVGWGLIVQGRSASALANGTNQALEIWGKVLLIGGLVLGVGNLIWGAVRWGLRWKRERWTAGKVAGKLIGGGIWRSLAVFPVVAMTLFLVLPAVSGLICRQELAKQAEIMGAVGMIKADYAAGKISANEYVKNILAAEYDKEDLAEDEYGKSEGPIIVGDLVGFINEHAEELEQATLEKAIEILTLARVDFGTDASGNVSKKKGFLTENVSAYTEDATTLNKATKTEDGHFVIFWTDTGDDAISADDVRILGEMLEEIVTNYRSEIGLLWTYEPVVRGGKKAEAMEEVLVANGLAKDTAEKAMSVFVANPYKKDSDVLATYGGVELLEGLKGAVVKLFGALHQDETAVFYNSVPVFPFVNILPENTKNGSLNLVAAHELGHHYAAKACQEISGKGCDLNDFVAETVPNWMAVNVIPAGKQAEDNVIQGHFNTYIKYICYSVNEVVPKPPKEHACHNKGSSQGYPAVGFMQNYAEIVPGSREVILTALTKKDAFAYLYEKAGEERFRRIMTQLTQRNLTNEGYGGRASLQARTQPSGESLDCGVLCERSYYIAPASSKYLYWTKGENESLELVVRAPGKNTISILGQKGGKWTLLEEGEGKLIWATGKEDEYENYALAVANYAQTEASEFLVKMMAKEMKELSEEKPEEDENGMLIFYNNCVAINFDNMFDAVAQLYQTLGQISSSEDSREYLEDLRGQILESKGQLVYKYATICVHDLRPSLDFEQVRKRMKRLIGGHLELINLEMEDGDRVSMLMTYDPLTLVGRVHFLTRFGGGLRLVDVKMEQKVLGEK